jgi:hypothetical protein
MMTGYIPKCNRSDFFIKLQRRKVRKESKMQKGRKSLGG